MKLKGMVDTDFTNYKKTSMFLIFPKCTFKCCTEACNEICQNSYLATSPEIEISKEEICDRYINNPMTEAFVFGGLEPFDSVMDLLSLIYCIRSKYDILDDIVIYTGYTEEEITKGIRDNKVDPLYQNFWSSIMSYDNIIIKYGRFRPNDVSHYDDILGVELASSNQYAKEYRVKHEN